LHQSWIDQEIVSKVIGPENYLRQILGVIYPNHGGDGPVEVVKWWERASEQSWEREWRNLEGGI